MLRQRTGEMEMRIAAAALILLFGTAPVYAQEKQFESTPAFDGCGDPSYEKAKSEGVTIAISPSQPFSFQMYSIAE